MDVSGNDKRGVKLNQVWLANENLLTLLYKHLDLLFSKVHWFDSKVLGVSSNVLSDFQKRINNIVELILVHIGIGCAVCGSAR